MDEDYVEGEYDEPGLMRAGGIEERFNPDGFFDGDVDATQAKVMVSKLKTLEDMLKAAEQFGQYAKQFCLLEAQMYIKIAECEGAEDKLTVAKKRLVKWIRSKSSDELSKILDEVSHGRRITEIERHDNPSCEDRDARVNSEMKRIQGDVVSTLKRDGCTQLTRSVFYDKWRIKDRPDKATVDAFTESTRDILLKSGGRGLGDEHGTYMLTPVCDRDEVRQIVENRINVIFNNIKSLAEICRQKDFYVSEENLQLLHSAIDGLGDDDE